VDRRLAEVDAERLPVELAAQGVHLVHQELEALDLDLGAGKAVQDDAVAVFLRRRRWRRRSITSRSPTMLPASFRRWASGESRRSLITIGPQVRPRVFAMKRVFVPLPAPGAPPRRMISFGKRRFSSPISSSRRCQTAPKMIWASLISRSVMRAVAGARGRCRGRGASGASSLGVGRHGRGLPDAQSGPDPEQAFMGTRDAPALSNQAVQSGGRKPVREHLVEAGPGGTAQAVPPWLFRLRKYQLRQPDGPAEIAEQTS
jgi:hypothetical protein